MSDLYATDEASGKGWRFLLGDSCERLAEVESGSVHLSVYSPPFASLYVYSDSPRDLGNSADWPEFFEHYSYIIRENYRVTAPGRMAAVHVAQIPITKALNGYTGLQDFRGEVIRSYVREGWIYFGEITIDKDPQAQAIRTKSHALMFVTKNRDSSGTRPALADYLLLFKKPGDNEIPIKTDVSNDEWIRWARPIWYGIRETNTLNTAVAKDNADERHIAPLQLDLIERCVRLWSNPGELVLSPFGGIGSEGYVAVRTGRRYIGCELKASYWRAGVTNLQEAEMHASTPALFTAAEISA